MVFPTHEQREVPCTIQQLERGGVLTSSKTVQSEVSLNQENSKSIILKMNCSFVNVSPNRSNSHSLEWSEGGLDPAPFHL